MRIGGSAGKVRRKSREGGCKRLCTARPALTYRFGG
jgi:hypothetical protein